MSLSADSIIDRIKLKEQIGRWRALSVLSLVLLALVLIGRTSGGLSLVQQEKIARVDINGVIQTDAYRDKILKKVEENDRIKAVIVHINSPGGTMVGSELLYKRFKAIADKKPVIAVMESVAASGGYMTAVASDYILAQEGTITGSIGVLFQSAEITDLSDKVGVTFNSIKSSPLKASPSPFEKLTPDVREAIEVVVQDNYELFLEIVDSGRKNLSGDALRKIADGRIFTGRQALKNGLIDAIGTEDDALKWLQEVKGIDKELPVANIKLSKEPSPFEKAFSTMIDIDAISPFKGVSVQGALALWQAGL